MKSIRTDIYYSDMLLFRKFLDMNEMNNVFIGNYFPDNSNYVRYICYAYSDKDETSVANMTYMVLTYGNIEAAFEHFKESCRAF